MKLRDLYPTLSKPERRQLAESACTNTGYLWQLATGWRGKKPSLLLIRNLARADVRLSVSELVDEFTADAEAPNTHQETPHA